MARVRKARSYFQKQPFLRFSGEMRNYLSFCKEWKKTVAPNHDMVFQTSSIVLRFFRSGWILGGTTLLISRKIQPDLKNLKTMDEVWEALEEEFGQVMENVSSLV